jgi:hypothetical protein
MHAAVDWSFELLFDDERRLLTRLSVFAGPFNLEASTKVCADDDLNAADVDVLMAPPGRQVVDRHRQAVGRDATSDCSGRSPNTRLAGSTRPARRKSPRPPHALADRRHRRGDRRFARARSAHVGTHGKRPARQPRRAGEWGISWR